MNGENPVCDRDCLNCIHPDCICDEPPRIKEARQQDALDKQFGMTDKQKAKAARSKAYYRRNREAVIAKQKAYNAAHRPQIAAAARKRYCKDRESRLEAQKDYYRRNREKILAKRKERLQREGE